MDFIKILEDLYAKTSIQPTHEVDHVETIMLPMHDGVKLATTIYFPSGITKGSIILQRCCYVNQREMLQVHAREFCRRGFIFAYQWCRGTGDSEGEWEPNIYDRQDGLDTVNYLAAQPYCKNIGYWGDSYLAYTGWCMADAVPEQVKTMFLGVYGCDRYTSAYQDGLFRQDILTAWAKDNAGVPIDADYLDSCRYRPQVHVDEDLWKVSLPWYRDWITNTDRDSEYWSGGLWKQLSEIPSKVKFPVFIKEGWYDHHLGSAMVTYQSLSEEAKAHSTLQIGPWNHGYMSSLTNQSTENLEEDRLETPLNWFYHILIEEELPDPQVRYYLIGEDRWVTYPTVPTLTGKDCLYLNFDSHSLESQPQENSRCSYVYDPENPVSSHGAESLFKTWGDIGSLPQEKPGYRDDVITLISDPLQKQTAAAGKMKVTLYVSSTAEDTAFTAKLMEVMEDGTTVNVRGTITTLAYRGHSKTRQTYEPGSIVEIDLEMWDIAWSFRKGSRIRLDISSSDFPQYAIHPNLPGIWSIQERSIPATQTVYAGKDYPSRIEWK